MKQEVNKTLIGGFVIAALALAFAGVMVFGSGKLFRKTVPYVMYFQESVKGLAIGAPVVFKGVKIGSVTSILLVADPDDLSLNIPVYIELVPDSITLKKEKASRRSADAMGVLIQRGLRAQLQSQSLVTGQVMIALDFRPDQPAHMIGEDKHTLEIPTIPSAMESLAKTLENLHLGDLSNNLSALVSGLERIVNSSEVKGSLEALHGAILDTRGLIQRVDRRFDPFADNIDSAVAESLKLIRDADNEIETVSRSAKDLLVHVDAQIGPLAENANRTLDDTRGLINGVHSKVDPLSESLRRAADSAAEAFEAARGAVDKIEDTLEQDSPVMHQATQTLKELSNAARSIRSWADYLERHPEALIRGKKQN